MPVLAIVITILIVVLMTALSWIVGAAHVKYKIEAPSMTGNPDFERVYRAQMNTIEQVLLFLPLFWIASLYSNANLAAIFGAIWIIGRILYARGYIQSAKKRGLGFAITFFAFIAVLLQCIWTLVAHQFFA